MSEPQQCIEGHIDKAKNSRISENKNVSCNNLDHHHPEIRFISIQRNSNASETGSCGFNLTRCKWDPYPWVSAVDRNSPACNAGLKVGDCVLEVNSEDILGLRISEIANKVKLISNQLSLLLWSTGRDAKCNKNSLCCGPMPLSLERLSASMQTILACLECPVCLDIVPAPVTQCQNGHILCIKCRSKSEKCPICRQSYSCVRSLIAEQIYSAILDVFKLNDNDDDDGDYVDTDDMHMNNIRSTGRKLREKLFGAKYKMKKQNSKQQQKQKENLFERTNLTTTKTTTTTTMKLKSVSTIGINDTTTTIYGSNLKNNKDSKLNKDYQQQQQQHLGSGNLFSNYGNGILTPTNRFLAKILGKSHSLENLNLNTNNSDSNTINLNNVNEYNGTTDEFIGTVVVMNNEKLNIQKPNRQLQQTNKCLSNDYLIPPSNGKFQEIKQFSQSTNDLSLSAGNQDENNQNYVAIRRCPSLNPIPLNENFSLNSSQLLCRPNNWAYQSGSLNGLNHPNTSCVIGYTNDTNFHGNASSCDLKMGDNKTNSNASLSINNSFSGKTSGLIFHKRPSASLSLCILNIPSEQEDDRDKTILLNTERIRVENVDTNCALNQYLTLTVPKINEIKRCRHTQDDRICDDYCNKDDDKKIKTVKLTSHHFGNLFLCPYNCCTDNFNALSLEFHVKNFHLVPIISFGTSDAEIALPLKVPMDSSIIELKLNERIFWIKVHSNSNGSIFVTALLQGTEDESSAFMLEGQLRNRVDDKLLEKQLIARSIVCSMMKTSWKNNIIEENDNISKNLNYITVVSEPAATEDVIEEVTKNCEFSELNSTSFKTTTLLENNKENATVKNITSTSTDTNTTPSDKVVARVKNINNNIDNIEIILTQADDSDDDVDNNDDDDEFNIVDCINNIKIEKNLKYFKNNNDKKQKEEVVQYDDINVVNKSSSSDNHNIEIKNINVNSVDNNIDGDDRHQQQQQLESLYFHSSSIQSTFNHYENENNDNNYNKNIELLLKICVKYR